MSSSWYEQPTTEQDRDLGRRRIEAIRQETLGRSAPADMEQEPGPEPAELEPAAAPVGHAEGCAMCSGEDCWSCRQAGLPMMQCSHSLAGRHGAPEPDEPARPEEEDQSGS